jgi:hypothetical protein
MKDTDLVIAIAVNDGFVALWYLPR